MSNYIHTKFPQYKAMGVYDNNGEWTKDLKGNNESDEIYLICNVYKGSQVYDYSSSKSILEAYIPSIAVGRKTIKAYYDTLYSDSNSFVIKQEKFAKDEEGNYILDENGDKVGSDEFYELYDWDGFFRHINSLKDDRLFCIQDGDMEITFRFKTKYADLVFSFMKPKEAGKTNNPFSNKLLPSHKEKLKERREKEASYNTYQMPQGYWEIMKKEILPKLSKQWSCKVDETLNRCYKGYGKQIKIDIIKKAEEENYKVNQWLGKEDLWDGFVDYCKSLIE